MKRIALPLMIAATLAACGKAREGEEAGANTGGLAVTLEEGARSSPSDITPIDAASGYAGGMPEESAMPRVSDAGSSPAKTAAPKPGNDSDAAAAAASAPAANAGSTASNTTG